MTHGQISDWDSSESVAAAVGAALAATPADSEQTSASDASYFEAYYRHVAGADLRDMSAQELLHTGLSHRRLASVRPANQSLIRIFDPEPQRDGWQSPNTVIQIVGEDMPHLVSSITSELAGHGIALDVVIHPLLSVNRNDQGQLVEVQSMPSTGVQPAPGWLMESWIHLEVNRLEPAEQAKLQQRLEVVLRDVRLAYEDSPAMRTQALAVAETLAAASLAESETAQFMRWLCEETFVFLAYQKHVPLQPGESLVPQYGLGLLRGAQDDAFLMAPWEDSPSKHTLVVTKADVRSTVYRRVYLDYVSVRIMDDYGQLLEEHRFYGLYSTMTYSARVTDIPIVRYKVNNVMKRAQISPRSHRAKDLLQILQTYPRDELFDIGEEDLYRIAVSVLQLQERRRTRLFLRSNRSGRFVSALIYFPRDRFNTAVRLRLEQELQEAVGADSLDYTVRLTESVLARLHFILRAPENGLPPELDEETLERRMIAATRSWDDDVAEIKSPEQGQTQSASAHDPGADLTNQKLLARWEGIPQSFKEDTTVGQAVVDLAYLDRVVSSGEDVAVRPYQVGVDSAGPADSAGMASALAAIPTQSGAPRQLTSAQDGQWRLRLYRAQPLVLSQVLPLLQKLGVEVIDEHPYILRSSQDRFGYIYDFGLSSPSGRVPLALAPAQMQNFTDAFIATWKQQCENDGLQALVTLAGLTWRQVVMLRVYVKYLRQAGITFSQEYIENTLCTHLGITQDLVRLFEARFDPRSGAPAGEDLEGRAQACDALVRQLRAKLDDVSSLDHDRILRALVHAIDATMRTNFYRTGAAGEVLDYVSIKLDPHRVLDLPEPIPTHEIFVYSPFVEGVHLRFGDIARGGLRWSDRPEDFRTEVLGLVKAQTVKNAVIVPTGAKGCFYPKNLPDPAIDRDAWFEAGRSAYKIFIRGLLDVTDNLRLQAGGPATVIAPPDVIRHDRDDTYLVVAADKGTATFSDTANAVAAEYGFWLGDAFASGGSVGYDHKAMGITAKGAWEAVRRHFREMGLNTQTMDFTAVGVGDMSGDVFGNGMLLSEHIRLVAAFDHRHIFIDPDPDAATSYVERKRLFELPRSSWADYSAELISAGGGVFPRSAKSIPITEQMRAALGLADEVQEYSPNQLLKAILSAPVDLLWNGGIGTYVKAATQSHAEVGDKANDAIRINGAQLRAKVVGEGGNLGLTQLGRIEAAMHGVRVNTDAIDNSAGVDCSDHEVNIKILVDAAVASGQMNPQERTQFLAEMTDEVGQLVLRDNYEQNVLLSNARVQSAPMLSVHQRFIVWLEQQGRLDRALEFLPDDAELARRLESNQGLTSPEFSVLVAYAKLTLAAQLQDSPLPDDPWLARTLVRYFPSAMQSRFADLMPQHPLRRNIVISALVNELVNRGGITFAFRAMEETGASAEQVLRAFMVCREVFDLPSFVAAVEATDDQISSGAQSTLYLEYRRLIDRSVRWFLQNEPENIDLAVQVQRFAPVVRDLVTKLPGYLVGAERDRFAGSIRRFVEQGVPEQLAAQAASLLMTFQCLDIAVIAERTGRSLDDVAQVYLALSERYGIEALLMQITHLPRRDRWSVLARASMRGDLYSVLSGLTLAVMQSPSDASSEPHTSISAWEAQAGGNVAAARGTLQEVTMLEEASLASLSVALRTLRQMIAG